MAETGAAFGGEHSAHYYFRDNYRADSGLIAAIVVLEQLVAAGRTAVGAARALRALRRLRRDQHRGRRPPGGDRARSPPHYAGPRPGPPRRAHRRPARRLVVQPASVQHRAAAAAQPRGRRPRRPCDAHVAEVRALIADAAGSTDRRPRGDRHGARPQRCSRSSPAPRTRARCSTSRTRTCLQPPPEAPLRGPRRHPGHADRRGHDVDDAEHDRLLAKAEAEGIAPTFEADDRGARHPRHARRVAARQLGGGRRRRPRACPIAARRTPTTRRRVEWARSPATRDRPSSWCVRRWPCRLVAGRRTWSTAPWLRPVSSRSPVSSAGDDGARRRTDRRAAGVARRVAARRRRRAGGADAELAAGARRAAPAGRPRAPDARVPPLGALAVPRPARCSSGSGCSPGSGRGRRGRRPAASPARRAASPRTARRRRLARRLGRTLPDRLRRRRPRRRSPRCGGRTSSTRTPRSRRSATQLPELTHNEIVRVGPARRRHPPGVLSWSLLRHDFEHPQVTRRFDLRRRAPRRGRRRVHGCEAEGDGLLAQLLDLVLVGDLVTLHLAQEQESTPGRSRCSTTSSAPRRDDRSPEPRPARASTAR